MRTFLQKKLWRDNAIDEFLDRRAEFEMIGVIEDTFHNQTLGSRVVSAKPPPASTDAPTAQEPSTRMPSNALARKALIIGPSFPSCSNRQTLVL